jgi:type I restriction enzyme S subunit
MTEWKEYKLGEIGTVITGKTPSARNPEDWGDNMLFITPSDYRNYRKYATNSERKLSKVGIDRFEKKILPANSILVTCIGSDMGKVVMNWESCITNQQINAIVPNTSVNNNFLYYRLISIYDTLRILGGDGTAVPIVNKSDFENIKIEIPPLPEQIRIASILSSLDDKIDLLHRENKTLEAMAETLFRQWFIEEAKEDWEEKHLSDYVIDTLGGDWGKENPEGDFVKPVQCIRGTDIADLNVGLACKTPIRFVKESKYDKIHPKTGDIIMEISGGTENQSTGRVAYINNDVIELFDYPLVFSNFCRLLRMEEKYTYFIYSYLQYLYKQDEFFNLENGSSGIKNLDYKALLYDLTYPMPSENRLIVEYNEKVSLYFRKINKNKKQIQTLTQQRDSLLPKLMSGEVKI